MQFPVKDVYGILMRKDSPLAEKKYITPQDLWDKPLMFSRNTRDGGLLASWLGKPISELHIAATYNLLFNASLMVDEGLGYAFALDRIINTTGNSSLCFIPCKPLLDVGMNLVWKKYQIFSKAAGKFLEEFRKFIEQQ